MELLVVMSVILVTTMLVILGINHFTLEKAVLGRADVQLNVLGLQLGTFTIQHVESR